LGVECVFDPVPSSSNLDNLYDSVGCEIGKIGDESIKLGTMGSDFAGQYRVRTISPGLQGAAIIN
jgi:hypothetical protein